MGGGRGTSCWLILLLLLLIYAPVEFPYQHFQWILAPPLSRGLNKSRSAEFVLVFGFFFLKKKKAASFNLPCDTQLYTAQLIGF